MQKTKEPLSQVGNLLPILDRDFAKWTEAEREDVLRGMADHLEEGDYILPFTNEERLKAAEDVADLAGKLEELDAEYKEILAGYRNSKKDMKEQLKLLINNHVSGGKHCTGIVYTFIEQTDNGPLAVTVDPTGTIFKIQPATGRLLQKSLLSQNPAK